MRFLLTLSFLFVGLTQISAQDTTEATVDVQAKFKGGIAKWNRYLEQNLRAEVPVENGAPAGIYVVTARFLVDSTGRISNIVIEKDPGYGTAEEMIRILKRSPRWEPATKNGVPVNHVQKQNLTFAVTVKN